MADKSYLRQERNPCLAMAVATSCQISSWLPPDSMMALSPSLWLMGWAAGCWWKGA